MRRMVTNKGVVEVVNQAIEDGEIEMEGGLPEYGIENIGQFLSVAEVASEISLVWADGSNGLPEIASGDAGKILKVNEQEDGVEWGESSNGLPEIASGDAGKVLKVNSGETGVEWGEASNIKFLFVPNTSVTSVTCAANSVTYTNKTFNYSSLGITKSQVKGVIVNCFLSGQPTQATIDGFTDGNSFTSNDSLKIFFRIANLSSESYSGGSYVSLIILYE